MTINYCYPITGVLQPTERLILERVETEGCTTPRPLVVIDCNIEHIYMIQYPQKISEHRAFLTREEVEKPLSEFPLPYSVEKRGINTKISVCSKNEMLYSVIQDIFCGYYAS